MFLGEDTGNRERRKRRDGCYRVYCSFCGGIVIDVQKILLAESFLYKRISYFYPEKNV
jgi:hypothetical protein